MSTTTSNSSASSVTDLSKSDAAPVSPASTPPAAPPAAAPPGAAPPAKRGGPIPLIIAGLMALGGIGWGISQWSFGRTHVSTDDAYVTGTLVNVGPTMGGTLVTLKVSEGDAVHAGDVIAQLDDSSQRTALAQAKAALASAQSQVPQARSTLAYQQLATDAAIRRAQAAVQAQQARTQGASAQLALTRKTLAAQVAQSDSQVKAARALAAQTVANVRTADAQVTGAQRAVSSARRGADALRARVSAADADVLRAERDEARYQRLLVQEAVTQQQFDSVHTQAESARAARAALTAQIAQADAQIAQAEAQVVQFQAVVDADRRAASASSAQVAVAVQGGALVRAGGAQVAIQQTNVAAAAAQNPQSAADVDTATAGREQVTLRREQVAAAQAQVDQAKAAVENAQVALEKTVLHAPTDGIVVRKAVSVGASLSPGQTVVTITQGNALWITANFKETQIAEVRLGQPVALHVDAAPGKILHGRVAAIQPTTGATVSLLPPDNATGNFTKVVQRIPVRIAITTEGGVTRTDLDRLHQGMSVVATIDTQDVTDHPEKIPAGWDGRAGTSQATTVRR